MLSRHAVKTAGFTLVEMAVVLVIIGLIIGGVLTAQQVSQNAKINSTVQAIKSYQAALQSYNQNYGALPGDDTQAATRFTPAPPAVGSNGDGIIASTSYNTQANTPANEGQVFWQHLRLAGLIKGDQTKADLPNNSFGGVFGVQTSGLFNANGLADNTNAVCTDRIPGNAGQAIDQQLDDGVPNSGTVRGGEAIGGAAATNYESNKTYILCTPL